MAETGQPLTGGVGWPANEIQGDWDRAYINYGKVLTPNWIQSGLTDAQFRALGISYFASLSSVEKVLSPTAPTSVYANPGRGVEADNAEIPLTKKGDGSFAGRVQGTSIVVNLPAKTS